MGDTIKLSIKLPVTPREIYEAWLDSEKHSSFTGQKADIERKVGSKFTVADGYITGENLKLYRFNKIIQSWRTTDFPEDAEDSTVTIELEQLKDGTRLTILHENIPEGEGKKYRQDWRTNYFKPMKEYFANSQQSE